MKIFKPTFILLLLLLISRQMYGQMYALSVYPTNGARPYLVDIAPMGTLYNGILTYAKGTEVTITAASNPVFTFSAWENGDTSKVRTLTINHDTEVFALYSAKNYLVGWDFYDYGNKDRPADLYASNLNKKSTLGLWHENGNNTMWLLYSASSTKLWYGKYAAVIWKGKNTLGNYYFQFCFNTKGFQDINVSLSMLGAYSFYRTQEVMFSTNSLNFKKLGSISLDKDSTWINASFNLPENASQCEKVYVRIQADKNSEKIINGNEGTSIADIYVFANPYNDGEPPVLVNTTPVTGENDVFNQGTIALNFDEKIALPNALHATLNNQTVTEYSCMGKTLTIPFSGLNYQTAYTLKIPANTITDLSGNALSEAVQLSFSTMNRTPVNKKKFDFIVGADGDFNQALEAAKAGTTGGKRFYIFFPNGEYNIGDLTGDGNQMTAISIPNVSYIGESNHGVILYNHPTQEGISITATIYLTSSSDNCYLQDLTLLNKMDYRSGVLKGRAAALMDRGSKNIYKNVKLLSNQDTYYSGDNRTYWETSEIHGTTDFICGGGDVFFNHCLIYLEEKSGPVITAPATTGKWGYVFMDCTIDGFPITNNGYNLGRPWSNSPKCVYINTIMKKMPDEAAWGNPMNVVPAVFAEYNSMTAGKTPIDLSKRRTSYTKDGITVTLNPELTNDEATQYTLNNVLSGNDNWRPNIYTCQIPAPILSLIDNNLIWENRDDVLCWAIFKNGQFESFTTNNNYIIPEGTTTGTKFSIRAANEMGGLGIASTYNYPTSATYINNNKKVVKTEYYSISGQKLTAPLNGITIKLTRYNDGTSEMIKMMLLE